MIVWAFYVWSVPRVEIRSRTSLHICTYDLHGVYACLYIRPFAYNTNHDDSRPSLVRPALRFVIIRGSARLSDFRGRPTSSEIDHGGKYKTNYTSVDESILTRANVSAGIPKKSKMM